MVHTRRGRPRHPAAPPHAQVFEAYGDVQDGKVLGLRFALLQNSLLWRIWMDQVGAGWVVQAGQYC